MSKIDESNGQDVIHAGRNNKESQLVFRALDPRAPSADSHVLQTILKMTVS